MCTVYLFDKMATYSPMQYEVIHHNDRILAPLQEFSRLRIDTRQPEMPVLYVAMATWIPKCNMYQFEYVLCTYNYFILCHSTSNNFTWRKNDK